MEYDRLSDIFKKIVMRYDEKKKFFLVEIEVRYDENQHLHHIEI
jgi:hypothetical protein